MKANELRIGNLFHPCSTIGGITIPNTEIFWKVGAIDKFGKVSVIEFDQPENIYLPINECAKIPLDESWLIRAGFVKVVGWDDMVFFREQNWESKSEWFELEQTINGFCHEFRDQKIEWVHQLMNLFFALTGTELQFAEE